MSKGLEALKRLKWGYAITHDERIILCECIEKELKALNEILALHDKWLGNEMSDFEFFTLLTEIKDKYDLLKEVLL